MNSLNKAMSTVICATLVGCCSLMIYIFTYNISGDFLTFNLRSRVPKEIIQSTTSLQVCNISQKSNVAETFASSVWCFKRHDGSYICNFRNLYFLPHLKRQLLFVLNEYSEISGVESLNKLKEINLSTVQNHTNLYLNLVLIKSHEHLLYENFTFVENNVLIMKRFKSDNIMHVIHDDLIPLFVTYEELCKGSVEFCQSLYQLFFLDDSDEGPYFDWYTYFSAYKPVFFSSQTIPVCIKRGVIGLSRKSIWFSYGFKSIQGPILNHDFEGSQLNRFSSFIKKKLGLRTKFVDISRDEAVQNTIVFLSRKINRKILNETDVENCIKEIYYNVFNNEVNILNMDLSVNDLKSLILALQKTHTLIGMHGSAMILGLFLPQGSTVIELFPFGIQPSFVSPLKALFNLRNMFYDYKEWVNKNESNTRTHPEYPPLHGGILHLPASEQHRIINEKLVPPVKCCHDPLYLFRMFQDTAVDKTFYSLVKSVLGKKTSILTDKEFNKRVQISKLNLWYYPPPVENLSCYCSDKMLKLTWTSIVHASPGVKYSVATSTGVNVISNVTHLYLNVTECDGDKTGNINIQPPLSVWVKTLEDYKESIDSYLLCTHS